EAHAAAFELVEQLPQLLATGLVVAGLVRDVAHRAGRHLELAGRGDVTAGQERRVVEQADLVLVGVHLTVLGHDVDAEPLAAVLGNMLLVSKTVLAGPWVTVGPHCSLNASRSSSPR